MNRRRLFFALVLGFVISGHAHDGGHGPKVTGVGNYGGVMTAVVAKSEASRGAHADLLYRAELVRLDGGPVQIFIYQKVLSPEGKLLLVDIAKFDGKATAIVASEVKKKWKSVSFDLAAKRMESGKSALVGTLPPAPGKPFNLDVILRQKGQELLMAFDNLD